MKRSTLAAVVVSLGCLALAGWGLRKWWVEEVAPKRYHPPPGGNRRPAAAARPPLPPLPPLKRPATFHLATVPRRPVPEMSDADWASAYPAFRHAPFESSGFNAISLPWRFAATPDAGAGDASDPAVAHAFALLLSYDLDWSPASFGTAHAYDVFHHSPDLLKDAEAAYDAERVAALVGEWGATHAVGGVLVRGKGGYVATLQVFDRDGAKVHEAAFEKPQEFFATLGDASTAALRFFGTPPSDALAAHLRRRRCEKPESLAALGKAALAEDHSPRQWALYEQVLKGEKRFSEARVWAAGHWDLSGEEAGDSADPAAGALGDNALAAAALELGFEAQRPGPSTQPAPWLARVEAMAGTGHPTLVTWRLRQAGELRKPHQFRPVLTREAFRPFVEAAAEYPNNRGLLLALIAGFDAERHPRLSPLAPYDPELLASLCLASAFSRAPAPHGRAYEWYRVAEAARHLGRPEHVLAAVARLRGEPGGEAYAVQCAPWVADARMELCDFEAAARDFTKLVAWRGEERAVNMAAVCAILAGRHDIVEQLAVDPRAQVDLAGEFLAACRKYVDGEAADQRFPSRYNYRAEELLIAEAELAQGGDFTRHDRPQIWFRWTDDLFEQGEDWRLKWVLLDRYYRLQPTLPHAAGLHEAAEWLHPEDPYVVQAVAAWRQAGGSGPLPTVEQCIANITKKGGWSGSERMPPWTHIARIRRELQEGRPDEAKRLFGVLEAHTFYSPLPERLARKIDEAPAERAREAPATGPAAGPPRPATSPSSTAPPSPSASPGRAAP